MRKYKGYKILKIEAITETIWSVKDCSTEETIQRFSTLAQAKQFINSLVGGK